MTKEYALYHGDDFIMIGTIEELAEYRNVSVKSMKWFLSPSAVKRQQQLKNGGVFLVEVESEDDE